MTPSNKSPSTQKDSNGLEEDGTESNSIANVKKDKVATETESKKTEKPKPKGRWLKSMALLTMLMMVVSFTDRWLNFVDLLTQFRFQIMIALLLFAGVLAINRYFRWSIAATLLCIPTVFAVLVLMIPAGSNVPRQDTHKPYRLLLLNVFAGNDDYDRVIQLIDDEDPDLICLIEYNRRWNRGLKEIFEKYPHTATDPSTWGDGAMLFSKHPVTYDDNVETAPRITIAPLVFAQVSLGDERLTLAAIHTKSPTSLRRIRFRNGQINKLAEIVEPVSGPVICCGDFNTTTFSYTLDDLKSKTGLVDSRRGFGLQTTWPSSPLLFPFRVSIDHLFVSEPIKVHDRRVGPNVGSDHYPVILDFTIENDQDD